MENAIEKLWLWNWKGGGYNNCKAPNREAALEKAKEMESGTILKVDESTMREATWRQIDAEDRAWGPYD